MFIDWRLVARLDQEPFVYYHFWGMNQLGIFELSRLHTSRLGFPTGRFTMGSKFIISLKNLRVKQLQQYNCRINSYALLDDVRSIPYYHPIETVGSFGETVPRIIRIE